VPHITAAQSPDDMIFRWCVTLFDAVSKQEMFAEAIAAFYSDGKDRATLAILETGLNNDGGAKPRRCPHGVLKIVATGEKAYPASIT